MILPKLIYKCNSNLKFDQNNTKFVFVYELQIYYYKYTINYIINIVYLYKYTIKYIINRL